MLVQLNRVFNGARLRETLTDIQVQLTSFSGAYTPPLTYVSAEGEGDAVVLSQTVTPLANGQSRVVVEYVVTFTVILRDANNQLITALGTLRRAMDVVLAMPNRAYTLEVAYAFRSQIGTVDGEIATITGCLLSVLKVLVKCEVIIKPCGCTAIPDAVLTKDITCQAVFNNDI